MYLRNSANFLQFGLGSKSLGNEVNKIKIKYQSVKGILGQER